MLRASCQFAAAQLCSHGLADLGVAAHAVEVSHAVRLTMFGHARAPAGQGAGVAALAPLHEIAMFGQAEVAKAWASCTLEAFYHHHVSQFQEAPCSGRGLARRAALVPLCFWEARLPEVPAHDFVLGLLPQWPDVAAHDPGLVLLHDIQAH